MYLQCVVLFFCSVLLTLSAAAKPVELPSGGTNLLIGDAMDLLQPSDAARIEQTNVDVTDQSFKKAVEVHLNGGVTNPWDVQYTIAVDSPIKKGDVLHTRVYARCAKSMTGTAAIGLVFEQSKAPFDKSMDFQFNVGTQWTVMDVPFVAKRNFDAGAAHLCIRLGFTAQRIQIGGIQLLDYGQGFDKNTLPLTNITYNGREADAAWRKAADDRIDAVRKSNLTVLVQDAKGQAVPGAQVHIAMQRHEFLWGTCVAAGPLLGKEVNDQKYRDVLRQYFNHVTIENSLKWQSINQIGYKEADAMIAWLRANDFTIRGHNLIWPGREFLPKQALDLLEKPDELRALCDAHITTTAARYTGQLADWDVINEPYANHLIQDQLGPQEMAHWFKLAHAADPKARLYINDYEILASGNQIDSPHQNAYFNTIKSLLDQGAPLEGIGIQGHFSSNLTDPETLMRILDRFASFGLPIKVTELDIKLDDEQLRADYMRDLTTILFSHPAVAGVIQWGFWEKSHWIPESAIMDKNWTLRPHGLAWVDLVQKKWRTDVTQETDARGQLKLRGFKGDYAITVTPAKGEAVTQAAKLSDKETQVIVQLK